MSFQVRLFCELSFQKIETTLSSVFFVWSVPDVALTLHFLLCSVCQANKKNAALCSHQSSRLCVALLSHGEDQTKTSSLIFGHMWEKGWRRGWWCQLRGLDCLFPRPLTLLIETLETFSQIPRWKDHSGLTAAGSLWSSSTLELKHHVERQIVQHWGSSFSRQIKWSCY